MPLIIPWDGKPISKPGLYSGVPMSAYHSGRLCVGPSISSSGLRTIFNESEAHFWDKCPLNHDAEEQQDTEAFILGRACHHLFLGEPFFQRSFIARPEKAPDGRAWNGNNASCKEWLAHQEGARMTVLTPEMLDRIRGMALSLGREPMVQAGALNGEIEITMVNIHPSGVFVLKRPDVIPNDSGDIVDLKCTKSVKYHDLVRTIGDYGYHQQGALIGDGYKELFGRPIASFSLYFIENVRPYCCRIVTLKDEDLALGSRQNENAIQRFVKCLNSGVWPPPGGNQATAQYIEMSTWRRDIITSRLKAEEIV